MIKHRKVHIPANNSFAIIIDDCEVALVRAASSITIRLDNQEFRLPADRSALLDVAGNATVYTPTAARLDIIGFKAMDVDQTAGSLNGFFCHLDGARAADNFVEVIIGLLIDGVGHPQVIPIPLDRAFKAMKPSLLEILAAKRNYELLSEYEVGLFTRAVALITVHLSDPTLSVASMARILGIQPRKLASTFYKVTGESMTKYVQARRIGRATEIIEGSIARIQLNTVASECGFDGQSYFAKIFKSYTGVTPRDYARNRYGRSTSSTSHGPE